MKTVQYAVKEFIAQSKSLYHDLRSDGQALSDVDLVALREQLYILDAEAGRLQDCKESGSGDAVLCFTDKHPRRQAA
jgi:hypothetical protein